MMSRDALRSLGTSPTAIEHHYDLPQDFFGLWKDADADVPVLKEAKAEYEKLK